MKLPNNLKFKKFHKIKLKREKFDSKFIIPKFCDFGLQIRKSNKVTTKQMEAARRVIRRFFKKNVYFKVNTAPYAAYTKKPVSARMGKGKGRHEKWLAPIYKGKILFEITRPIFFLNERDVSKVFKTVGSKLSVKTKTIKLIY